MRSRKKSTISAADVQSVASGSIQEHLKFSGQLELPGTPANFTANLKEAFFAVSCNPDTKEPESWRTDHAAAFFTVR